MKLTTYQQNILAQTLKDLRSYGLSDHHILAGMAEEMVNTRDELRARYGDCPITDALELAASRMESLSNHLWDKPRANQPHKEEQHHENTNGL